MRLRPGLMGGFVCLALLLWCHAASAQRCLHNGDVNRDGLHTPADVVATFEHFLNPTGSVLTDCEQDRADVDAPLDPGAHITPADALCNFRRFLGIPSCLINTPPVADAGADLNAAVGVPLALDGSASHDEDGDILTMQWSLQMQPEESTAAVIAPERPNPQFLPDVPGTYVFELVANDGQATSQSAATTRRTPQTAALPERVTVTVFPFGEAPPNAHAGPEQQALVGATVQLDGSRSSDPELAPLTFAWSFTSLPEGSTLTAEALEGADGPAPTFVPDVEGTYVINLLVSDGTLMDEDTVQVVVAQQDVPPNANAGVDVAMMGGQEITLDASASFDPDTAPEELSFSWIFVALPAASTLSQAAILEPATATPSFTPDVEGAYLLRVRVSDGVHSRADNVLVFVDDTPPVVQVVSPENGAIVDSRTPTLVVTYRDEGSGVNLGSYMTLVNGVDVTVGTVITATTATYTVIAPLPAGDNTVTARITDHAGNTQEVTSRFTVSVFQAIADCAPTSGTVPLQVSFTNLQSTFTGGSIELYRWDFEGDGTFDTADAVSQMRTFTYREPGTFTAVLEITNNLDAVTTDTCTIEVQGNAPTATADAVPSNGAIPLEVTFTCTASDPDGSVVLFEWDFEGDGTFDFSSETSGSTTHTYTDEGTFVALCRVTDNDGFTGEARTTTTLIRPGPPGSPSVRATTSRPSGNAPLSVSLNGTAMDDGNIVRWEWDFEGDGIVDFVSPDSPATTHEYTAGGIFAAALRVTDNEGLTATDTVEIVVNVNVSLAIPDDTLTILPPGTLANLVRFLPVSTNVSSSLSGKGPERAIDGDLNTSWFTATNDVANQGMTPFYEVVFPADVTVTQINMRGNRESADGFDILRGRFEFFDANDTVLLTRGVALPEPERDIELTIPERSGVRRVRFTDLADEGARAGFAELEVLGPLPENIEVPIQTTLTGDLPVSLFIRDASGIVVRTLVDRQMRPAGTYTDLWNGADNNGALLPQGVYYAVLEYDFSSELRRVDLTDSTGGVRYNPPRDALSNTFRPFDDDLLTINFTVPENRGASEILAFIGLFNTDTRFMTLLEGVPLGVGDYTIHWDGIDPEGNFAVPPPGDSFLFGIFGFTLPDNAIVLQTAPELSNIAVEPNFFDPSTPNFLTPDEPTAVMTYDLNQMANVELTVTNLTNGLILRRIIMPNVPAGMAHTLVWDGRSDDGILVDHGNYRLTLRASDATGSASLARFALVRVFY